MLDNLNGRLEKVKEQQQRKLKWEKQLAAYKKEAKEIQLEHEVLKEQLLKEEKDVEKLENGSFMHFLFTIVGKYEDRLDKEKQELLTARLKYDEKDKTLKQINESIIELRKRLSTLPNIDVIYKQIMAEKEQLIKDADSPLTEDYFTLTHQIAELKANAVETEEAIRAGERALNTLERALESLGSAENWGTFDLLGGGMITTAIKHNRIDEAKEWIHQAQTDLRAFQKELADVHIHGNLDVDVSSLLTFADYFFDNFITDWMVQGRIEDSTIRVENQKQEIEQMVSRLRRTDASIEMDIKMATAARNALIESA